MTPADLGDQAPPTGPLPDTRCVLEQVGDRYRVRVQDTGEQKTLDYALGSGKTGTTYIAVENKTTLIEMRKSYFPSQRRWFITPGQEQEAKNPTSIGRDHGNLRKCVLCHAVTLPSDSLHPEPKFMGVGCESCHGPASAHVQAMTQGKTNRTMEKLTGANGDRINALCGRCHRTVEDVLMKPDPMGKTQRFPVFGLASSRCFQASQGKLTCITCHNPHQNARTDAESYNAICLKCHAAKTSAVVGNRAVTGQTGSLSVPGHACPVNPRAECVRCHMPRHKVFDDTALPTTMADHFIKVYRK